MDNYDGEERTGRTVYRFSKFIGEGIGGIAVGMATTIPPHILTETIDATLAVSISLISVYWN